MSLKDNIQLRTDTSSNFSLANPILLKGERAWESESGRSKLGTGNTDYRTLDYVDQLGPHYLKSYLTVNLPDATTSRGCMVWLESIGQPGYSDGTSWHKVEDGGIVAP